MKVFLGGTCNKSTWRDKLIPLLKIDYFNPVVDNWTEKHQEEEKLQRVECDFVLYTLTPQMKGVYSVAEVIEDVITRPQKTILCILKECDRRRFEDDELKSLEQVAVMVKKYGGRVATCLESTAKILNGKETKLFANTWNMFE